MKIVHLCLGSFFIDNYTYQENMLPKYHVLMGYEVTVIASLVSFDSAGALCFIEGASTYWNADGVKVIRLNYNKKMPFIVSSQLRFYEGLYKKLDQEKPDLIFIHGLCFCDVFEVKKYVRRNPQITLYADSHTDYINSGKKWLSRNILHKIIWRKCYQTLLPYIKLYFGVTPLRCEFLMDVYRIPMSKVKLLLMGVDDRFVSELPLNIRMIVREEFGIMPDDFVIISGGKLDSLKNTDKLISSLLQINNPKAHLIIFGTVTLSFKKKFDELIDRASNIHYVGWASHENVIKYILSSDLACYPGTHSTLWEESVGLGVPCIFKRWIGMQHLNINGNCFFVSGDDLNELKTCIQTLVDSKLEYNKIKCKADIAAKHFKYSDISKQAIGL